MCSPTCFEHLRATPPIGQPETNMKAMDVMVRDVITVGPEADVRDAIKLLVDNDVSALPVVDAQGMVVGIISEADLVRREEIGTEKHRPWWLEAVTPAATLAEDFAKSHGKRVDEVMSTAIVSASEETSLSDIATLLEHHRIKRVPILRDGKLVGIVSRSNLIQAIASSDAPATANGDSDRRIRADLLTQLAAQKWTDFGARNIIVSDGVVHLWGLISSEEERKALIALAEDVVGVKSVSDEMIPSY
jgi:CBS-domain-containing membrane protein